METRPPIDGEDEDPPWSLDEWLNGNDTRAVRRYRAKQKRSAKPIVPRSWSYLARKPGKTKRRSLLTNARNRP